MATNLTSSEEEVVWQYNSRANIENHIKELVWGFGLGDMPSGDFKANAMYFSIGVMTYNLWIAQKLLTLPQTWWNKTISTMRWAVIETAGKMIRHGRQVILSPASTIEKYR
ncbi:MAG: transposase, partial [Candidatus Brocadiales bacterium]